MIIYISIILFFDVEKFSKNFLEMKYEYVPVILTLITLAIIVRVFRQRILLKGLDIPISFKDNFLLFFYGLSMQSTPAGLGAMIKSQFIKENYGHSLLKTMPIVLVERFHDLFAVFTILVVFVFFYPIFEIQLVLIVIFPLLGFIYIIARYKRILTFLVNRISKIKFLNKFLNNLFESQDSLEILSQKRILFSCWGLSLLAYAFEAYSIYFSFRAFGLDFNIIQTSLITFTSFVIGAISFIPGGIGLTEASLIGLLLLFEVEPSLASTLAIFIRLTTIWFATIVGFIGVRFLFLRSKKN